MSVRVLSEETEQRHRLRVQSLCDTEGYSPVAARRAKSWLSDAVREARGAPLQPPLGVYVGLPPRSPFAQAHIRRLPAGKGDGGEREASPVPTVCRPDRGQDSRTFPAPTAPGACCRHVPLIDLAPSPRTPKAHRRAVCPWAPLSPRTRRLRPPIPRSTERCAACPLAEVPLGRLFSPVPHNPVQPGVGLPATATGRRLRARKQSWGSCAVAGGPARDDPGRDRGGSRCGTERFAGRIPSQ